MDFVIDDSFFWHGWGQIEDDGTTRDLTDGEMKELEETSKRVAEWAEPVHLQQWYKICSQLQQKLMKHRWADPFKHAVPLELVPDYAVIVKHPMDLSVIDQKLKTGLYVHPDDYIGDVRLMLRNAHLYNREESAIHSSALALSKMFEEELVKLRLPQMR